MNNQCKITDSSDLYSTSGSEKKVKRLEGRRCGSGGVECGWCNIQSNNNKEKNKTKPTHEM